MYLFRLPSWRIISALVLSSLFIFTAFETYAQQSPSEFPENSAAIKTLEKFRDAIVRGDRVQASRELAQDAIIMQAGERATRDEYINKHIIPECEYVYSVDQTVDQRIIRSSDSVVWISTTYLVDVSEKADNKTIHRKLAELAVLSKERNKWKISMIHWSNCPRYVEP